MLFVNDAPFKVHTREMPGTTTGPQATGPVGRSIEHMGLRLGLMRLTCPSSTAFEYQLLSNLSALFIHCACHVPSRLGDFSTHGSRSSGDLS